jgi:hypothetical protein
MATQRLRLGTLLVDAKLVTQGDLDAVLATQRTDGRRLGTLLVERGLINETQLTQILSHQLAVPWVSLLHIEFSRQLLNLVPHDVAERYCLVPIYVRHVRNQGETLYVAMDDPSNEEGLKACGEHSGLPVRAMIAPPQDIRSAIRVYYGVAPRPPSQPPPASLEALAVPVAAAPPEVEVHAEEAPPSSGDVHVEHDEPAVDAQVAEGSADELRGSGEPQGGSDEPQGGAGEPQGGSDEPQGGAGEPQGGSDEPQRGAEQVAPGAADGDDGPEISTEEVVPPPRKSRKQRMVVRDVPDFLREAEAPAPSAAASESEPPPSTGRPVAEIPKPRGRSPRMVALTLLDGTTITLPAKPAVAGEAPPPVAAGPTGDRAEGLTARDLVAALRAVSHGADATEILGADHRWETMFAALLSLLLKKHLIADWEFVEELKKI